MSTDMKLAHFVLQTGQLPVLRDWYLKVLDAHVVYENQFLTLMTFDEEHHRLGIVQLPQPVQRSPMTVGLAHTAYTFPSLGSLLAKYGDLNKTDIHPHVPVQHGPTRSTTSLHSRKRPSTSAEKNFTPTHSGPRSIQTRCSQRSVLAPRNPSCSPGPGPGRAHSGTSPNCCCLNPNSAQQPPALPAVRTSDRKEAWALGGFSRIVVQANGYS